MPPVSNWAPPFFSQLNGNGDGVGLQAQGHSYDMSYWCTSELRICGKAPCLQAAKLAFEEACDNGQNGTVVEYGPFATKWTTKKEGGMSQTPVWLIRFKMVRARDAPLRLPEARCVECGAVGTNHLQCPKCNEHFYCGKKPQEKDCARAHMEQCEISKEQPLDQYDSEFAITCFAKYGAPWEKAELELMSAKYPEALFQLRFVEQSAGFAGTIQAQAGRATISYVRNLTRQNTITKRQGQNGHGAILDVKVRYNGPYADLLAME